MPRLGLVALLAHLAISAPLDAAERTQALTLQPGWNAIWLEVSPTVASGDDAGLPMPVEDVFGDANIDVVARPFSPVGTTEFISDPADTFNEGGWIVWHRSSSSGNTLTTIRGNQAYLVHNSGASNVSQDVTGSVRFFTPTWAPGNYNLVGFGISGSPTFGDFFGTTGESGGVHPVSKTFVLNPATGQWEGVQDSSTMTPGAAYWVYAERNSTFSGPVAIDFDGTSGLDFGEGPGDLALQDINGDDLLLTPSELTFTNTTATQQSVSLTKVDPATSGSGANGDALRLYRVVPVPDALAYTVDTGLPISSSTVTVTAAASATVTLGAQRGWSTGDPERENLYRIEVAIGSSGALQYFWLPATAARADLEGGTLGSVNPDYAGLWVGQANLTSVTSIAEAGAPEVATTSTLPIQIIIHVDSSGTPSLLSHILFMQTKTADDTIPSEPVLVVDEEKIPFFEGILLRDGKRVGRRVETAAYDMPLLYDAASQPTSLLTTIAELNGWLDGEGNPDPTQVNDARLEDYTLGSATRPAGFVENYALTWPLEGGLGPGSIVRTADASPLRLDPFHRSNPFRHAFHPDHGTGYLVTRTISISFDDNNADSLLTGSYTEAVDGLTNLAEPLVASGTITLRRVSDVDTLQ